jgi:hypothetical protein
MALYGCSPRPPVEQYQRLEFEDLPSVDLQLVLPPGYQSYAPRYVLTAQEGLRRFGEWLAPYGHAQLRIVERQARGAHDTPRPDEIVFQSPLIAPARGGTIEAALLHAIAKVFLASPKREAGDPWLIDGLALYLTIRELGEQYGDGHALEERYFGGHIPYLYLGVVVRGAEGWIDRFDAPPKVRRAVRAIHTLERLVGWGALQQALTTFVGGDSSRVDVFQTALEQASGRDLGWFFIDAFDPAKRYDYGVESLVSTIDAANRSRFYTTVVVHRYGDGVFSGSGRLAPEPFQASGPLEVSVRFEDGSVIRDSWDGRAQTRQFDYESTTPAVAAALDPDHVLRLDADRSNNEVRLDEPKTAGAWSLRWATWLQDALLSYAWAF